MKHNSYPAKKPTKFKAALLAGLATLSLTGDAAPAAEHEPRKGGGDGRQDVAVAPALESVTITPEFEEQETARIAEALTNSAKPAPNEQGSNGINQITVLNGSLETTDDDTGEKIRVIDPIVSAAVQRPLNEMPTGWIIVQTSGDQSDGVAGRPVFRPVDLSEYEWVSFYPENPEKPYLNTYGRLVPTKNGTQMTECGPGGEPLPGGGDIPGQIMPLSINQLPPEKQ